MRIISEMEWNLKAPLEWEWENMAPCGDRTVDSGCEIDGKMEYNASIYKSEGSLLPCFNMVQHSSLTSSISMPLDTFLLDSTKRFEVNDSSLKNVYNEKEIIGTAEDGNFPSLSTSNCSGEEMIGLKLGRSSYFGGMSTTSNGKCTTFPVLSASSSTSAKRSRVSSQSMQTPRCQVEGCNFDLTSAKDYHRRHKICETHSKSPKVIVGGMERRFCQQCSRLHELSEFDNKKRSCRRRLSDHNARRRRPQPEAMQLSYVQTPSLFLDQKSQMNFLINEVPVPISNPAWAGACTFQVTLGGNSLIRPVKAVGIDKKQCLTTDEMITSISLPTLEDISNQSHYNGLEAPAITSNMNVPQDFQRALSLLSTTASGFNEPKPASLEQFLWANIDVEQQGLHSEQSWALSFSKHMEMEQVHPESQFTSLDWCSSGSHLFKADHEPSCSPSNQII